MSSGRVTLLPDEDGLEEISLIDDQVEERDLEAGSPVDEANNGDSSEDWGLDYSQSLQMLDAQDYQLNRGQRFLNGLVGFSTNVAWVTAIDANWRDMKDPVMDLGVPGYDVVKTVIAVGTHEANNIAYTFTRKENPLNYILMAGDGSFALGLAREGGKRAAALAPPILFQVGLAYGRQALFDWAGDMDNPHPYVLIGIMYARTALIDSALNVTATRALYALSQKGVEKIFPSTKQPQVTPENNPDLYWFQPILDGGVRTLDAVAFAEMMRQVFLTFGPAIILHSEHALMIAPVIDLMVLEPLRYLAQTPRPFTKMDIPCGGPRGVVLGEDGEEDEPLLELTNDRHSHIPSKGRQCGGVAIRAGIALSVLTLTTFANMYLAATMPTGEDADENSVDPSVWSMNERLAYQAALAASAIMLNGIIKHVPDMARKVYNWATSFSLFSRSNDMSEHEDDDLEQGLRNNGYDSDISDAKFAL